MVNEKRLIDANELVKKILSLTLRVTGLRTGKGVLVELITKYRDGILQVIKEQPTVDAVEVVPGQRLYNAHEVAEIIAELFGDCCACNHNGIDEWLPDKCELQSACPNPVGVACWEQYLKYREAKMDGARNGKTD